MENDWKEHISVRKNLPKMKMSSNRKHNPYQSVLIRMYGITHRISYILYMAGVIHKCPAGAQGWLQSKTFLKKRCSCQNTQKYFGFVFLGSSQRLLLKTTLLTIVFTQTVPEWNKKPCKTPRKPGKKRKKRPETAKNRKRTIPSSLS